MSVHLSLNDPTITSTATVLRCTVIRIQPILIKTNTLFPFHDVMKKKGRDDTKEEKETEEALRVW